MRLANAGDIDIGDCLVAGFDNDVGDDLDVDIDNDIDNGTDKY